MSLKAFHLFFITISVVLAVGLGVIALRTYLDRGGAAQLGWSALSFAAAIALVIYGARIRRKLPDVGLLVIAGCCTLFARTAMACSVCYGDPEDPQTQAMNMAIVFMLIIVASILTLFAAFFVHLRSRARQFARDRSDSSSPTPYLEVIVNE